MSVHVTYPVMYGKEKSRGYVPGFAGSVGLVTVGLVVSGISKKGSYSYSPPSGPPR